MMRSVATVLLCLAAIVAGDVVFRTSLLQHVRPVVLAPLEQAVLAPPVEVQWDGPLQMRVWLSIAGGAPQDLGLHTSPMTLGHDVFPREGGYQVELRAPRLGNWIRVVRQFQVRAPLIEAPPPTPAARDVHQERMFDAKDLMRGLEAARTARDKAHARAKFLSEENNALRDESERLAKQLEALYEAQEADSSHVAELERRLGQLTEEQRALAEENGALRLRLSAVIPCTVWGYYSYPRPNTIPVTRQVLLVSDSRGQILRNQTACELVRRTDSTAASICFCVGSSWGG